MCEISKVIEDYFDDNKVKKLEVAEKMGMPYPTFNRKTNPYDPRQLLVTELIPYTINTDFSLLDHIENRLGRVAVSLPKRDGKTIDLKSISQLASTSGKTLATMADALADGKIDDQERKDLTKILIKLNNQVNIMLCF